MQLLAKRQVAARMGCHYATIEARVRRAEFPAATLYLGPNSPRWADSEIDRLIDLLAQFGDPHESTKRLLIERATRLKTA
jgi:predicted DNA-binding transcriptional regulator AlpA